MTAPKPEVVLPPAAIEIPSEAPIDAPVVAEIADTRPEWAKNPPADQVVVSQVPICDTDGSVIRMQFFNASGQQVR